MNVHVPFCTAEKMNTHASCLITRQGVGEIRYFTSHSTETETRAIQNRIHFQRVLMLITTPSVLVSKTRFRPFGGLKFGEKLPQSFQHWSLMRSHFSAASIRSIIISFCYGITRSRLYQSYYRLKSLAAEWVNELYLTREHPLQTVLPGVPLAYLCWSIHRYASLDLWTKTKESVCFHFTRLEYHPIQVDRVSIKMTNNTTLLGSAIFDQL